LEVVETGTCWRHSGNVSLQMSTSPTLALVRELAANGTARRIRVAARLSIYDIARDLGVKAGTVSRWETGKRTPQGEAALRWAQLLSEIVEAQS